MPPKDEKSFIKNEMHLVNGDNISWGFFIKLVHQNDIITLQHCKTFVNKIYDINW